MTSQHMDQLLDARSDLRVALSRSLPSDDQIIMGRVRRAADTLQILARTSRLDPDITHGVNCEKKPHVRTGQLHGESDDTPFDVDGVMYCGRCHVAL